MPVGKNFTFKVVEKQQKTFLEGFRHSRWAHDEIKVLKVELGGKRETLLA